MDMPLEIERKFLIHYPDTDWLAQFPGSRRIDITQTYLQSGEGESRRVRRWYEGGQTVFFKSVKRPLTDRTRVELEEEIGESEYTALLEQADPERLPIRKTRWCIPFADHTLEIDLYDFWVDQATLECELQSEDEAFEIPPEITVIREVTEDRRYLNSSLARSVPPSEAESREGSRTRQNSRAAETKTGGVI